MQNDAIAQAAGDEITRAATLRWYLASTVFASIGRNGYFIVCAWILADRGAGSESVAVFLMMVSLTELLSSPIVGMVVDRIDRRRLCVLSDVARGTTICCLATAVQFVDPVRAILASAFFFSFFDRLSLTCSQALIPGLTVSSALTRTNSAVFFSMQFGSLLAALAIAMAVDAVHLTFAFSILALAFLIAAGSLVPVRVRSMPIGNSQFNAELLPQHPPATPFLRLILVYALLYSAGVLVSVLGSSFVVEELNGSAADFARLEAAWSFGSIAGALMPVIASRLTKARITEVSTLIAIAASLGLLKIFGMPWILGLFLCLGAFYNFGRVNLEVQLQSNVRAGALGRAKGIMHSAGVAVSLVVFGAIAILNGKFAPSTVFAAFGALMVIAMAACILLESSMRNPSEPGKR